jgi:hypothetical protein
MLFTAAPLLLFVTPFQRAPEQERAPAEDRPRRLVRATRRPRSTHCCLVLLMPVDRPLDDGLRRAEATRRLEALGAPIAVMQLAPD